MRLLPNPRRLGVTVPGGRTYTGVVDTPLDNVPEGDGNVLVANGWTKLPALAGVLDSATSVSGVGAPGTVQLSNGAGAFLAATGVVFSGSTLDLSSGTSLRFAGTTFLESFSANTLALHNGAVAQSLQIFGIRTNALNYEAAFFDWTTNAGMLTIGTAAAGSGVARGIIFNSATGTLILGGAGHYTLQSATGAIGFQGRGNMKALSDGVWRITSNSEADFGRLQLGGSTSSFPSIKRSGAAVHARLADDTAFADMVFRVPTANPGPGTLWNNGGVLTIGA